jgi:hypothetical protein
VGFFDDWPPLPPDPEPEPPREPWHGPPANELGVSVPIRLELVRTDAVLVGLVDVTAYSTGFEFELTIRRFEPDEPAEEWMAEEWWAPHGFGADAFQLGMEYADGSRVVADAPPTGEAPAAVLANQGGGGGGNEYEDRYWVWPLPPSGPLAVVCRWPRFGVSEQRLVVDAELIRRAAAGSTALWPSEGLSRGGWSAVGHTMFAIAKPEEAAPDP